MSQTVIYILGAGNSGSTLLSMALGGHSQMASVGELVQLERWCAIGGLCSCGATLRECDVWGEVMRDGELGRARLPLAPVPPMPGALSSNARCFGSDNHIAETIDSNLAMYQRIQAVFGCDTIVDASKTPLHFYYLYRSGYFRLVPVLLVRDGAEYIESSVRRGRSFLSSMLLWLKMNLGARRVLREAHLEQATVQVNYRDLVAQPEKTLQRICQAAGLAYEPEMMSFYEHEHHNVAGTRSRFKPGPINESFSSRVLPPRHRLAFRLMGGRFWNRVFEGECS